MRGASIRIPVRAVHTHVPSSIFVSFQAETKQAPPLSPRNLIPSRRLPNSFDGFFLRTASFDIPAERKSAFALEMDDVRVMLRDSSRRSLALVDELGKGTSARCSRRIGLANSPGFVPAGGELP